MKTKLLQILGALLLALTIAIPTCTLVGCAIFGSVAEGSRPEVVRAEQFAKISFATTDAFLEWEATYRSTLGEDVKSFAARLRAEFPPAFTALRSATKAYKALPSTDNLATLQTARNVLQLVYDQLLLYAPTDVEAAGAARAKTINLE